MLLNLRIYNDYHLIFSMSHSLGVTAYIKFCLEFL